MHLFGSCSSVVFSSWSTCISILMYILFLDSDTQKHLDEMVRDFSRLTSGIGFKYMFGNAAMLKTVEGEFCYSCDPIGLRN